MRKEKSERTGRYVTGCKTMSSYFLFRRPWVTMTFQRAKEKTTRFQACLQRRKQFMPVCHMLLASALIAALA